MNAGYVAPQCNVGSKLVQLVACYEIAAVGEQSAGVVRDHLGMRNDERLVEESFEYRSAGSRHRGVPGGIGRMQWTTLGIGLRQQVAGVLGMDARQRLGSREALVDGIGRPAT